MSNNLLIIESDNDKFFIESLKAFLNNIDLEIDFPVCSIDDYECLGGLFLSSLKKKLSELKISNYRMQPKISLHNNIEVINQRGEKSNNAS